MLFTQDTKPVVEEQKKKAQHVADTMPVDALYRTVTRGPNARAKHNLLKKKSLRCESLLESYHNQLAHFANGNSRKELADYLCLLGTCRHNVRMRHLFWWNDLSMENRAGYIEYFAKEPQYYNESDLCYINQLAVEAGSTIIPFPHARKLQSDNGERFFSEYFEQNKDHMKFGVDPITRRCLCTSCSGNTEMLQTTVQESNDSETENASPAGVVLCNRPAKRMRADPILLPANSRVVTKQVVKILPAMHNGYTNNATNMTNATNVTNMMTTTNVGNANVANSVNTQFPLIGGSNQHWMNYVHLMQSQIMFNQQMAAALYRNQTQRPLCQGFPVCSGCIYCSETTMRV